jgi:hypothetical protein
MKTKLTLTVRKEIIQSAKRIAKERNVSVSKLFEEVFCEKGINYILTERQKAGKRFLEQFEKRTPIKPFKKSDKELVREQVKKKYDLGIS